MGCTSMSGKKHEYALDLLTKIASLSKEEFEQEIRRLESAADFREECACSTCMTFRSDGADCCATEDEASPGGWCDACPRRNKCDGFKHPELYRSSLNYHRCFGKYNHRTKRCKKCEDTEVGKHCIKRTAQSAVLSYSKKEPK